MYINLCTKSNKILFSFFTFSNLIISKHGVSKREKKERQAETQISRTRKEIDRARSIKRKEKEIERQIETETERDIYRERERDTERDRKRERDTERDRERKKRFFNILVFLLPGATLKEIFLESSQCYAEGPRNFFWGIKINLREYYFCRNFYSTTPEALANFFGG